MRECPTCVSTDYIATLHILVYRLKKAPIILVNRLNNHAKISVYILYNNAQSTYNIGVYTTPNVFVDKATTTNVRVYRSYDNAHYI